MGDLLDEERGEELTGRPGLGVGRGDELLPDPTGVGQVQPPEQPLEVDRERIEDQLSGRARHDRTSRPVEANGRCCWRLR